MRFIIPEGKPFYCEFTIKEPNESTPMDLSGSIGKFSLSTIGPSSCLVLNDIAMNIEDAVNGLISVSLSSSQTSGLVSRVGFAEDGYPMVPTYKASIYITGGEEVYVEIPKVYISDGGDVCSTN